MQYVLTTFYHQTPDIINDRNHCKVVILQFMYTLLDTIIMIISYPRYFTLSVGSPAYGLCVQKLWECAVVSVREFEIWDCYWRLGSVGYISFIPKDRL